MSDYSIVKVYEFYEANVRDAVNSVQAASDSIPMEFLIGFIAGILSGLCLMRFAL